jgi:hypothetical protein
LRVHQRRDDDDPREMTLEAYIEACDRGEMVPDLLPLPGKADAPADDGEAEADSFPPSRSAPRAAPVDEQSDDDALDGREED